jgi:hypothetical protein
MTTGILARVPFDFSCFFVLFVAIFWLLHSRRFPFEELIHSIAAGHECPVFSCPFVFFVVDSFGFE